jgi:hypothetical protein
MSGNGAKNPHHDTGSGAGAAGEQSVQTTVTVKGASASESALSLAQSRPSLTGAGSSVSGSVAPSGELGPSSKSALSATVKEASASGSAHPLTQSRPSLTGAGSSVSGSVAPSGELGPSSKKSTESADVRGCVTGPTGKLRSNTTKKKLSDDEIRLRQVLFPTEEERHKFEKKVGCEFSGKLCLDSVRFLDLWKTHKTEKNNSAMRKEMLQLAAERHAKTAPSSSKTPLTKRTHSFTPSPSVPIPKVQKMSVSPQVTSKEPTPPTDIPLVYEDEQDYGALSTFATEMEEGLSYSDAVKETNKKTPRVDNPHILWIHKGKEDRATMYRETWKLILEKLQEKCLDLALAGKEAPRVLWSAWGRGVGILSPDGEASQLALMEMVATLTVADQDFKAWKKGERDRFNPITLLLPAAMKASVFTPAKVVAAIAMQNNMTSMMEPGRHVVRSCESITAGSLVRRLRLGVTDDVLEAIKAKGGRVQVGLSVLEVHAGGKPLVPVPEEG